MFTKRIAFSFVTLACFVVSACQPSVSQQPQAQAKSIIGPRHTVQKIQFGGLFDAILRHTALSFVPTEPVRSSLIISPGASIPASAMSGFAGRLADQGVAVYVVEYTNNVAILQPNLAFALAEKLKSAPEKIKDLDPYLLQQHKKGLAVSLFGHSLGGAVLGNKIDEKEAAFIKSWMLFGVSSVLGEPKPGAAQVKLIKGAKDGLLSAKETETMEKLFGVSTTSIEEVTHFCIADSDTVGSQKKRQEEVETNQKNGVAPSTLTSLECQDAVAKEVLKHL